MWNAQKFLLKTVKHKKIPRQQFFITGQLRRMSHVKAKSWKWRAKRIKLVFALLMEEAALAERLVKLRVSWFHVIQERITVRIVNAAQQGVRKTNI